jgi:hypothetical protein
MDTPRKKLEQRTESETTHEHQQQSGQQQTVREFGSAEEMLQHDAEQTIVPETVEIRLKRSTTDLARPPFPWWKRWFRG